MYPFGRFLLHPQRPSGAARQPIDAAGDVSFYCRPWDIDIFGEMNNGRVLTLYDLGRFDLTIRIGLPKLMRKHGWGFVVAGSSVTYRKRIRLFDRVSLKTQIAGYDAKWIYILQSMWVAGKPCNQALLRTAVTRKSGTVPTAEVLDAMGSPALDLELPAWAPSLGRCRPSTPLATARRLNRQDAARDGRASLNRDLVRHDFQRPMVIAMVAVGMVQADRSRDNRCGRHAAPLRGRNPAHGHARTRAPRRHDQAYTRPDFSR